MLQVFYASSIPNMLKGFSPFSIYRPYPTFQNSSNDQMWSIMTIHDHVGFKYDKSGVKMGEDGRGWLDKGSWRLEEVCCGREGKGQYFANRPRPRLIEKLTNGRVRDQKSKCL